MWQLVTQAHVEGSGHISNRKGGAGYDSSFPVRTTNEADENCLPRVLQRGPGLLPIASHMDQAIVTTAP